MKNQKSLPLCLLVIAASLGFASLSVKAETEASHPNYRYIKPIAADHKTVPASPTVLASPVTPASPAALASPVAPASPAASASPVAPASPVALASPAAADKPITLAEKTPPVEPVTKPTDGHGALPTFAQADSDGDHYVTKAELKNYPYLLQVFDKVDAGEDGKLEQHEYQNLEMETKREGEVR
ncbi:EF-hand domain-containing protein [Methylovulum psychrotolerans]|uniref:EF-hand domain-containing protein n=1 Tax=Methylovulum psychrotolerans TaxID=1704499 RepID=UPI002044E614|nr:EF-hand domain-containing protein [Methylovulum psychrotolerans]